MAKSVVLAILQLADAKCSILSYMHGSNIFHFYLYRENEVSEFNKHK